MSVREILEELPRLDASERQTVLHRLIEIDPALEIQETPEMLAAIDEAVRSFDADKGISIEEARRSMDFKVILQPLALDDLEAIVRVSP